MESVGNILIYLCNKGKLPWMPAEDIYNENEQRKESKRVRNESTIEILCEGLPDCFLNYMNYVRDLEFDKKPNY